MTELHAGSQGYKAWAHGCMQPVLRRRWVSSRRGEPCCTWKISSAMACMAGLHCDSRTVFWSSKNSVSSHTPLTPPGTVQRQMTAAGGQDVPELAVCQLFEGRDPLPKLADCHWGSTGDAQFPAFGSSGRWCFGCH